ncbi:hypothetical protein BDV98DRAFT_632611 [Pterulicium gracile]|uniref:Lysine-specific metallo-endopeptidase domain-containing protein n=1 Tax=Pterulicium gracile TaxID=1884261 RepID=A0A5C3Q8G4_9AGAR|nr:hypothetical protein BDV98DRAFT_632611 [Pterula gracilis]
MFRASVLLSLATLALGLATGDLQVSIKAASSSVSSIDDIVLIATVTNPTGADIRVIKTANILDSNPTESFSVTKGDKIVDFTGIILSPDFERDGNFITIPAGESISVNHNVAALYNFEEHGTGSFTFTPWTIFQTEFNGDPLTIDVDPITVEIVNDVANRELFPSDSEMGAFTSTPSCNDSKKLGIIRNGLTAARALAGGAAADIRNRPNSAAWTKFFGGNISRDDVWWRFDLIAGDLASSGNRKIFCNQDPANLCGSATAYTRLVRSGGNIISSDIYMCSGFFTYTPTSKVCTTLIENFYGSLDGVVLHELSHATVGTTDHAYGCGAVQKLSTAQKFSNADNYECMSLAVHRTFKCGL